MASSFKKEFFRFLVMGTLTVCLDFFLYSLTQGMAGLALAKGVGFVGGAIFAFFANRAWTFASPKRGGTPVRFSFLYLGNLALNVASNHLLLALGFPYELSFLFATAASAASNFVGMKFWVFSYE